MANRMKARFLVAAGALAAMGFAAYALVPNADKALVYCPVGIDAHGCDAVVTALSGSDGPFPGGVDRGYDGSSGTIDLATADLSGYAVFVVPSLADGDGSKPYELLRNSRVAHNLSITLRGRLAIWSGTPDQGTANRTEKNQLIRNLAVWARGDTAAAERGGIIVLQDHSDDAAARYQWLAGFAGFAPRADPTSDAYDAVQALTQTASAVLDNGGQQLAYESMASFGLEPPANGAGAVIDARGTTGNSRAVLLTATRRLASVKSDQDEYLPGDTVTFTGSGWSAGEVVTLSVHQEPTRRADTTLTTTADASGAILLRGYAIQASDLVTRFYVTARGQSSQLAAQATFADAVGIRARDHEGQRKNPDGTLDGYTNGNVTGYTEGDFINFRFKVSADEASTGTLQVRFTGQTSQCLFFEPVFQLGAVQNVSGTAPTVTTVGTPVADGEEFVQTLSITFTGAGEAVVNYTLKLSTQASDCTGASQHSRLNAGAGVSQSGAQNVPVPANQIRDLPTQQADVSITKTGPAEVDAEATVTYTLTVSNAGPTAATNVSVTDQLDPQLTFISATGDGFTCGVDATNKVTCTRATLGAGTSATITITARAPPEGGTVTNVATVSATEPDPNQGNNTSATVTTTVRPRADVSITKTGPATVDAGAQFTYTLTVSNAGPSTAHDVTVTDQLPAGVTGVSASGGGFTCNYNSVTNTVTCTRASLAAGASAQITITATAPNEGGTLANTATVTAREPDPNPGNNTSNTVTTTVVAAADLAIDKTGPTTPVNAGANFNYTIAVTNNGPSTATNVTVTDVLPPGVTFVSASGGGFTCTETAGTVTCTRGSLAAGATATITLTVTAPNEGGTIAVNTARVTANEADPNQGNNQDTAPAITVTPQADLSITKTDSPDPVFANGTLTYTVTVTNAGPSTAAGVVVTDNLPAGVTFTSATPSQGTCTPPANGDGGTVTCNLGSLAPGASATVSIVVTAPAEGGQITNTASVTAETADQNPNNNSATATTTVEAVTDLAIDKSGPATAVAGTNITYTLAVTNNGPSSSTGGTVTDVLPAGATFVSASGACTNAAGTVSCSVGALAAGATQTFTITVRVAPDFVGALVNTATVTANETDPTPANNTDAVTTTIVAEPDVTITKTAAPPVTPQGGTITYTITVTNAGPSTALGVTVTDNLPGGVSFGAVTTSQGSCTQSGGTVSCNIGTMQPGTTAVITITVTATGCGAVTNTATVSATNEPATKTANNSASATSTIDCPPGKVTGGGQIGVAHNGSTGRGSFGFNVQRKAANLMPTGSLEYIDHAVRLNVHSLTMLTLLVTGTHAEFSGTCTITGASSCTFSVSVDDLGEPGKNDTFSIRVEYTDANGAHVYTQGGTLQRGNIQIHKQQ